MGSSSLRSLKWAAAAPPRVSEGPKSPGVLGLSFEIIQSEFERKTSNEDSSKISPALKEPLNKEMCKKYHIWQCISRHTIRKCKRMAGQNTFEILLLNDANMIGEH